MRKTLPFRDHSFDGVLLFTVLTCMPMESEQRGLFAEVERILRPNGLVYISDLLLKHRFPQHASVRAIR